MDVEKLIERLRNAFDADRVAEKNLAIRAAHDALAAQAAEIKTLREALGRIGWHELTWEESRDIARAALAATEPKP